MAATAEVTGGSVDNLKLVGSGKPYLAMTMADAAKDAIEGADKFKATGKVDAKTLLVLYPNRMHVVTVEGTNINKFSEDDKEKLEIITKRIINKILHHPTIELRKISESDLRAEDTAAKISVIRDLFGLNSSKDEKNKG